MNQSGSVLNLTCSLLVCCASKLFETVTGRAKLLDKVVTFLPEMEKRFKVLIDDLATVTQYQVDKARGILRDLVGGQIPLHATADGAERYLTAEVSGDYSGLARLTCGPKLILNPVYRNVYYFTATIRIPLRVTQAEAKRANANK
jgi:hypothetical protein